MKRIFSLTIPGMLCAAAVPIFSSSAVEQIRFLWVLAGILLMIVLLLRKTIRKQEPLFRSDPIFISLALILATALVGTISSLNVHETMYPLMMLATAAILYWCLVQGQVTTSSVVDIVAPGIAIAGILTVGARCLIAGTGSPPDPLIPALLIPMTSLSVVAVRDRRMALLAAAATCLLTAEIIRGGDASALLAFFPSVVIPAISIARRRDLVAGRSGIILRRGALVVIAWTLPWIIVDPSSIVRDLSRRGNPSSASWNSLRNRWEDALRIAGDNRIAGVGCGNYLMHSSTGATTNAQNLYLHALAEQGIVGLVLLLFVFYAATRRFGSYLGGAPDAATMLILSGSFASVAAFFLLGCLNAMTTTFLPIAILVAMFALVECAGNHHMRFTRAASSETYLAVMIVLLLIGLFFGFITVKDTLAECSRERGVAARESGDLRESVRLLEESSGWRFNDWRTQWELGRTFRQAGQDADAKARLEFCLRLHPHHAGARRMLEDLQSRENGRR